ncbi:GL15879 [Drosophila persimilis]|uniref:non-specific serine/threonine protein kinase n=1 Tax=Drosophila persimilis TaxID=7234 RepID=B4GQA0_DROPE|nr:casein kinase I [Drosophila persimilis]EDW39772.1 GL15879 [Drosophila persimilis]
MESRLVGGKYRAIERIGGGAFGEVYSGICVEDNTEVAIKIEPHDSKSQQLANEAKVCQKLGDSRGFPTFFYYGSEQNFKVMVVELLGPSLYDLYLKCSRHFSLKTILMLASQMMARLEAIHAIGYIHRDVKPENFLMGRGDKCNKVFLIDFGMSHPYRDFATNKHINYSPTCSIFGTLRFLSVRAQNGNEQSRRDDLESLMYCLIYFYKGLPWIGLSAASDKQKTEMVAEMKRSTKIDDLCGGFPPMIAMLMKYIRNLRFEDEPDYVYMRMMLRVLSLDLAHVYDLRFDWTQLEEQQNRDHESTEPESTVQSSSVYRSCLNSPDVGV